MMNVFFVIIAKRVISDVLGGLNSKCFSLAPLASSKLPFFCVNMHLSYSFLAIHVSWLLLQGKCTVIKLTISNEYERI